MGMRRFTRLTNGFSKKIENHIAMVAIRAVYYNFARIHKTLRITPALAAGLSDHVWSLEEIVQMAWFDGEVSEARPLQETRGGMRRAICFALICGVLGFAIAFWLGTTNPSRITWMPSILAFILCPPGILAAMTATDPDRESLYLIFGPLNATLYAVVGFMVWRYIAAHSNKGHISN
jgi:hypothetical protein